MRLITLAVLMLAAGEYPNQSVSDMVAPSAGSGSVLDGSGNLVLNATTSLKWGARAQLTSPVNGLVQLQPAAGGNGSALTTGLVLGLNDATGASLMRSSNGVVRVMTGNQGANGSFESAGYTAIVANTFYGYIAGPVTGINITTNSLDIRTNSTVAIAIDSTQNSTFANTIKLASKTADPTGSNGMLYYDSTSHRVRAYVNGAWGTLTFTAGP